MVVLLPGGRYPRSPESVIMNLQLSPSSQSPRFLSMLLLLLASHCAWAQQRAINQANLKRLESEHLRLYFTSDFAPYTRPLLEEGERFLAGLAGRWSVILPKDKIVIALGGPIQGKDLLNHLEHPPWLMAGYDRQNGRVEIRILDRSQARLEEMAPLFRHTLVHALLNLPRIKRPPQFLQEGLARYYAGDSSGHTRMLAVLAFKRHAEIESFVEHDSWAKDQAGYLEISALSGLLVEYMWRVNPEGEVQFVQALQKGVAWKTALRESGFQDWQRLLVDFNVQVRKEYGLHTLLYTYDLWLLLLGTAALVWFFLRVYWAIRAARLPFVELPPAPEVLPASALKGPAFGDSAPTPAPRASYTPVQETATRRLEDMQLPSGSRVKAVLEQPESEGGIVPPPRPGASLAVELQPGLALQDLSVPEEDVDEAFERILTPETQQGQAKLDDAFKDVEHDLDDVFDSFTLQGPKRRS